MSLQLKFNTSRLNVTQSGGPINTAGAENSAQNALKRGGASESADKCKEIQDNYLEIHDPDRLAAPSGPCPMRFYRTNPPLMQTMNLLSRQPIHASRPEPAPPPKLIAAANRCQLTAVS